METIERQCESEGPAPPDCAGEAKVRNDNNFIKCPLGAEAMRWGSSRWTR